MTRSRVRTAFFALLTLAPVFALARPCALDERSILGPWQQAGAAVFEVMEFSMDDGRHVFSSWLHQRPEIANGTWSLKDCVLRVAHPTEAALSYEFVASGDGRRRLVLREKGDGTVSTFRRPRR